MMVNTFYKSLILMLGLFSLWIAQPSPTNAQSLQLGDGVRITFYNIEEPISGDYYVMQDWMIQLPYVGLVPVRNKAFDSLRTSIIDSYGTIYREPELTVQPLFRINVLGEINEPGIYYVTGFEKLTDLLAQAGGETNEADLDKIFLIRDGEQIDINAKKILKQGQILQDFGLESGDQIYVSRVGLVSFRNASLLISGLGVAATIAAIFITRR